MPSRWGGREAVDAATGSQPTTVTDPPLDDVRRCAEVKSLRMRQYAVPLSDKPCDTDVEGFC
jgi:hypothetical protein